MLGYPGPLDGAVPGEGLEPPLSPLLQAELQCQLALLARTGPQSGPRLSRTPALARGGDRGCYLRPRQPNR
jgi:hypothetical protein